ncbi:MAG: cytochrome c3 family protein [Saprospiraceae bacterium]|nr:cytochrome c3 family protein [Saprospiraceae bacterium]
MKYLIVLGIIAGVIVLMVQYPHTMLSPGELTQGHQDLSNDCFSCHTPFGGIENDKCIACHKLSEIGMNAKNGLDTVAAGTKILFHEKLSSQSCLACHTDHQGIEPEKSLDGFKHNLLSETVINDCISCHQKPTDELHKGLNTNCKACHNTEGWKYAVKFDHDMLAVADRNNCVSCHENPGDSFHKSLKDNCSQCHSTDKWVPATFDHDAYFLLDQDHNVSCNTCHRSKGYDTYTCYGCHEHSESNIRSEHNEEGIYNYINCVSCHRSADEDDIRSNGNYNRTDKQRNRKDDDD